MAARARPDLPQSRHRGCDAAPRARGPASIRDEIERNPSRYLLRELDRDRRRRRRPAVSRGCVRLPMSLVSSLACRGDDLAFVDNTTTGANAILRSSPFAPGDEIRRLRLRLRRRDACRDVCRPRTRRDRSHGGNAVSRRDRRPKSSSAFVAALGPKTRLAVVDHITSQSALILPLAAIADACRDARHRGAR